MSSETSSEGGTERNHTSIFHWRAFESYNPEDLSIAKSVDDMSRILSLFVFGKLSTKDAAFIHNPAVFNIFRLLQISIQYQMDSQELLEHELEETQHKYQELKSKNSELKRAYADLKSKLIRQQNYERCPSCGQLFESGEKLDRHFESSHSELLNSWNSIRSNKSEIPEAARLIEEVTTLRKTVEKQAELLAVRTAPEPMQIQKIFGRERKESNLSFSRSNLEIIPLYKKDYEIPLPIQMKAKEFLAKEKPLAPTEDEEAEMAERIRKMTAKQSGADSKAAETLRREFFEAVGFTSEIPRSIQPLHHIFPKRVQIESQRAMKKEENSEERSKVGQKPEKSINEGENKEQENVAQVKPQENDKQNDQKADLKNQVKEPIQNVEAPAQESSKAAVIQQGTQNNDGPMEVEPLWDDEKSEEKPTVAKATLTPKNGEPFHKPPKEPKIVEASKKDEKSAKEVEKRQSDDHKDQKDNEEMGQQKKANEAVPDEKRDGKSANEAEKKQPESHNEQKMTETTNQQKKVNETKADEKVIKTQKSVKENGESINNTETRKESIAVSAVNTQMQESEQKKDEEADKYTKKKLEAPKAATNPAVIQNEPNKMDPQNGQKKALDTSNEKKNTKEAVKVAEVPDKDKKLNDAPNEIKKPAVAQEPKMDVPSKTIGNPQAVEAPKDKDAVKSLPIESGKNPPSSSISSPHTEENAVSFESDSSSTVDSKQKAFFAAPFSSKIPPSNAQKMADSDIRADIIEEFDSPVEKLDGMINGQKQKLLDSKFISAAPLEASKGTQKEKDADMRVDIPDDFDSPVEKLESNPIPEKRTPPPEKPTVEAPQKSKFVDSQILGALPSEVNKKAKERITSTRPKLRH